MATQLRLWPGHGERDGIVCSNAKENPQMGSRGRNGRAGREASSNSRTRGTRNRKVGAASRMDANAGNDRGGMREDTRGVDGGRLESSGNADAVRRRTRLAAGLPPRLSRWLRRVTRVHAHLCNVVRLYGAARANVIAGDQWRARALAGDRTILLDAIGFAAGELEAVRLQIETDMEDAAPVAAAPGSPEKVAALALRVERFQSLFVAGDTDIAPPMDRQRRQGC